MSLDVRDMIIQQHAPAVMVPTAGELQPLDQNGHRYLVARDGVYLDLVRPWLRMRQAIAPAIAAKLPYGDVQPAIAIGFGKLPREHLKRFLDEARRCAPFEHAAWLLWDDAAKRLEYFDLDVQEMSEGAVRYNRPKLEPHQSLAVDLHSHGHLPAYFSPTDDVDDHGEVKIAGVVGNLADDATAEWKFRLCALGLFKDLPGPKDP
jgi:PRTRC genetic system protein A